MKLISLTSYFTTILSLVFGVGAYTATAQPGTPPQTVTFKLPPAPDSAALKQYDLRWIKTDNDFDQSQLDRAAIDKEIEKRLKAYDRKTAIVTYAVPINSKLLLRPKYQKYVDFNPLIGNLSIAGKGGALDKEAYFWRYGDIDIAVPGDTYKDQMNVYAVARAVEILKYRYPTAYNKLFVETRNFAPSQPIFGNPKYKNKYSVLLFSFDESPDSIAGGLTAIGKGALINGFEEYSNVSVVSIDSNNIQGSSNSGSKPIYMASPEENYVRYLREGLIETLVHEMLHRYIDYRHSYDVVFNKLYWARYNSSDPLDVRLAGEEAITNTTSLNYFNREGGLQSNVLSYYSAELNLSINKLTSASRADYYASLVNPGTQQGHYKDRLRLDVLN